MPESYRVKMVEPIYLIPRKEREKKLKNSGYNVFMLNAEDVYIDLLSDSGMSAMSDRQWAAMIESRQAYAGSPTYRDLTSTVKELFGFDQVLPVHQGRAAENIFFSTIDIEGKYALSNMFFDTTEANVLHNDGTPVNLVVKEAYELNNPKPFKGNIDLKKVESFIKEKGAENIAVILLTITNNTGGGQPVSMENIKATAKIAKKYKIPFFFDAARFAENAYFIHERESSYANKDIRAIVREMFSYVDGFLMSGKKDALTNIGGLLALRNKKLYEKLKNLEIIIEGFPTYGGMASRELAAMAQGLRESTEILYQQARHANVRVLHNKLVKAGVPVLKPCGGHAVYIDGAKFLPHIPKDQFPAQALTAQLYIESGIRAVELGLSAFGKNDPKTGKLELKGIDFVRLTIPRRLYTDSHMDYVADSIIKLYKNRKKIRGLKRTFATEYLAHFTARFEPV